MSNGSGGLWAEGYKRRAVQSLIVGVMGSKGASSPRRQVG